MLIGGRRAAAGALRRTVPLIEVDRVNGVYKARGVIYASELAALQSLDPAATQSGQVAAVGPVVVTGAPELVVNGDFATGDLTGWASKFGSGGPPSFAVSAGSMLCTVNGATQSRIEQIPGFLPGESYLAGADLTRNGADVFLSVIQEASYSFPATVSLGKTSSNGTATVRGSFVAQQSRSFLGIRQNLGTGTSWNADNVSVKLCRPTNAGWQRKHRWRVSATAKVLPTNNELLFCLTNPATGAANNYEYLAVYRRSSDSHIIIEQGSQSFVQGSLKTMFSVDLGAVADGATFTIEVEVCNRIRARLGNGAFVQAPASPPVNYPILCIGKAFYAGTTTWTGTIQSYTVDQPASLADSAMSIIGVGNSLPTGNNSNPTAGVTSFAWGPYLTRVNLAGAAWYNNMGRPGATSAQIRNGLVDQSDATYADYLERQPQATDPRTVLVVWTSENDSDAATCIQNTVDIVNKWKAINGPNARFIVVEPLLWANPSGHMSWATAGDITAGYRSAFGANSFDLKERVCAPTQGGLSCQGLDDAGVTIGAQQPSDQTDFANLVFPASLRNGYTDQIHPGDNNGNTIHGGIPIANAVAAKFAELAFL